MAINIQSLFADIIDTPEQRQQKLLQQGVVQGQLLSSGLRGRAAALAPLAQVAGQLGVQRQEDLRRAVQPMIGIDPRTTGEKLQEQLGNIDTSTPEGLMQAARAIQSIDPVRAASLRQASAELTRDLEDRALNREAARSQIDTAAAREARAVEASQYEISRRSVQEDLADINIDAARLQRDLNEMQLNETREQTDDRNALRATLLDNMPNTPETARTRALIETMDLPSLQSFIAPKPNDFTEIETEMVSPITGKRGTGIVMFDRNNPKVPPVFIAMKSDGEGEYKRNSAFVNKYSKILQDNPDIAEKLSDDNNWIGTNQDNVELRATLLAEALDRELQANPDMAVNEALDRLNATSINNLRQGVILPAGPISGDGEWGIAGEEGQPTPDPQEPPAPPSRLTTQPPPNSGPSPINNIDFVIQANPNTDPKLIAQRFAQGVTNEINKKTQQIENLKRTKVAGAATQERIETLQADIKQLNQELKFIESRG
jgi:hypothetical protein